MTASHHPSNNLAPLDRLPKPFVNAMRTLFDIMDDQRTGFVRFSGSFLRCCIAVIICVMAYIHIVVLV